jgi:hypothetical protein
MIKPCWLVPILYSRGRFVASTVFNMTWVSQFCSVVGLDDVDGLLAGFDFIGLCVCVCQGFNFIDTHFWAFPKYTLGSL